jgi:PAS domain S-box-containing protein
MKRAKSKVMIKPKILPSLEQEQKTINSPQKSSTALPEQPEEEVGYLELELIEELHQSEENLRLALEAGNMGIWDWHLATGELRWSEQLERLFGLEPGSFPGTYEAFIQLVHPDDRSSVQKEAQQVALGQPYDQDYRIILPAGTNTGTGTGTGTVRYMNGKGRLYRNAQGEPDRVLGLTTDITDRKKEETNRQFLVEAGEVLTSSLDYETVLKNLSRLVVPRLADWCTIDLADEQQEPPRLRALILTHCDPHKEKFIYELKQAFLPQQDETNPMVQVLVTGRSSFISRIPAELIEAVSQNDPALRQLLSELGLISAMYVPLIARGRSLGVLSLNTDKESGRELTADDLALVEELARRAALAADNARLYRDAQLARRQAEAASERLRRLQEVTAALSKAITSQEVIRVMLEQGRAAAKADIASVILATTAVSDIDDAGAGAAAPETVYRLVAVSSGGEASIARQWYPAQMPLDANLPAVTVAKTGQALWMEDLSKAPWTDYPSMQQARLELGRQAYALVPIRTGHSSLGTLALGFNEPRGFNADEQDLLLSLATQSAQALERARLYDDLQKALKDRDEFLSVAAHELKTPLTGLKGFTQLLVRQLDKNGKVEPARLGRSLQAINTQSDKLARLVDQLLNLTRIEAGRLKLEKQTTNVNSLLASIVVTASTGIGASHHIELKLPNEIVTAQLDPLRIEQVVNNLLDNAVKYSPNGGVVTVELALTDGSGGGEEEYHDEEEGEGSQTAIPPVEPKLSISVRDRGIGIPPERRSHIFERFYQAHSLGYISGMGLGLYISQQIIELHEGQIRAEFPASGGTRFVITLPLS